MRINELLNIRRIDEVKNTIEKFFNGSEPNVWIQYNNLDVYLRKSKRILDNKFISTIDLANVNSEKPGSKTFHTFIEYLENLSKKNGYEAIYVENILNDRLVGFFDKLGYKISSSQGPPPSMYKIFK